MENTSKYQMQDPTLKESVDVTIEKYETATSTGTMSQLLQDLAFLRKDFNEYVDSTLARIHVTSIHTRTHCVHNHIYIYSTTQIR